MYSDCTDTARRLYFVCSCAEVRWRHWYNIQDRHISTPECVASLVLPSIHAVWLLRVHLKQYHNPVDVTWLAIWRGCSEFRSAHSVIDFVTAVCDTMLTYGREGVVFGHAPLSLFVLYTLRTVFKYKIIWFSIIQVW